MDLRKLDLNLLVALDALLTERSITEAGRKLRVTQSGMSGSLARLREFFEDELLVQIGRKMLPTPLGEALTEPVRATLLQLKAAVETRPEFNPETASRLFSLMMSDYVSAVLMTDMLQRVEKLAPRVRFKFLSSNQAPGVEALERGDVDLLIVPDDYLVSGHPHEALFTEGYTCVVWTGNTTVGPRITPQQYLELGHVCVQLPRCRSPVLDEWFLSRLGVNRRVEVTAMTFSSVPQCVVGTQRIATVQTRLAEFCCKHLPLRIVPCPFELPTFTESVQWHKRFAKDPGRNWLCGVLKEVANVVVPGVSQPGEEGVAELASAVVRFPKRF